MNFGKIEHVGFSLLSNLHDAGQCTCRSIAIPCILPRWTLPHIHNIYNITMNAASLGLTRHV